MSHMPKTKNPIAMTKATTFTTTSQCALAAIAAHASLARGAHGRRCRRSGDSGVDRPEPRVRDRRSAPTRRRRGGRCPRARRGRGARARSRRSRSSRPTTRTAWSTTCFAVSVARTFTPHELREPARAVVDEARRGRGRRETSCGSSASCAIAASAMRQRMSGSCDERARRRASSRCAGARRRRRGRAPVRRCRRTPRASSSSKFAKMPKMSGSAFGPGIEAAHDAVGCRVRAVEHGRAALARAHADGVPVVEDPSRRGPRGR